MAKPRILHMFSPGENVSPFDVNMAGDAGFEVIVPYRGVTADSITALVQDAIFSRPPKRYNYTGGFIGGNDVNSAADMLERARKALVPPFEMSLFADPNGAYTTSAAMVALVEHHLRERTGSGLSGRKAMIFGGGPVGLCAAVLIAQQGGEPVLVRLTPTNADKQAAVDRFAARYGVTLPSVDGQTAEGKAEALKSAHIVLAAAKAGVQVVSRAQLDAAPELLVAADVNAVPPAGIEGVEVNHNGVELLTRNGSIAAIGALAVGKYKYDTQHGLFRQMLDSERAVALDFPDAYRLAVELVRA